MFDFQRLCSQLRIALSAPPVSLNLLIMKQIFCEHPVIIRNPQLKELLITHRCYTTLTGDHYISFAQANYFKYRFPDYQFSPRRFKVTLDNIDRFNIFNEKTGEVFPMFIQVPCGKCVLCRDKKAREWSFRATCENVFSESIPLFLTLTYNNENLPKYGVFKEEVQLFLKRLRISLDRLYYKHNLRYFACAEYGSKSKRPHYHMLIWNFPREGSFRNIWNVTHFIEKCWSKITGYDGKKPVYFPIGYVYTLPCDKGAIGYVINLSSREEHLGQYVTASKVVENQTCVSYSYIIKLRRADFKINRKRGDIRSPHIYLPKIRRNSLTTAGNPAGNCSKRSGSDIIASKRLTVCSSLKP
jgi:hypothetical protein